MGAGAAALVLILMQEVVVGVVYAPPATAADAAVRRDLESIRQAGYNMVVPLDVQARERIVAPAAEAGLTVGPLKPDAGAAYSRIAARAGARATAEARVLFWSAIADGARDIAFAAPAHDVAPEIIALGETAGIVTRNEALFGALKPRRDGVRSISTGDTGPVEVKLLESAEALLIIGLNHAASPQMVTIRFAADVPEAIWQNMETGTSVNFVMEKDGPFLEHRFAPKDSLVLMIRKRLRR